MVFPAIVAAVHIKNAPEGHREVLSCDPVQAGFDDFADQPAPERDAIVDAMYFHGRETDFDTADVAEQYIGALAAAVVDTATSTGNAAPTLSLLLRAARKHYAHELLERAVAETHLLSDDLNRLAATLTRGEIKQLDKFKSEGALAFQPVYNWDLVQTTHYNGTYGVRDVLSRSVDKLARVDLPAPTIFMPEQAPPQGQTVDAVQLVTHGLQVIRQNRLSYEARKLGMVRNGIAMLYPGFLDISARRSSSR
jgi:hypothetical protein